MVYLELMRELDRDAERIHTRLNRTVHALNTERVDYAVIGGNAVDIWLRTAGAGVLTRDVDILLRKSDIEIASNALSREGFVRRDLVSRTMFLDGPNSKARDAVHVVFAGEKYKPGDLEPSPGVDEYETVGETRVISLRALTLMKLTADRSKDRGHIVELLKEGIIDSSMIEVLPDSLKSRFQDVVSEFESTRQEWE